MKSKFLWLVAVILLFVSSYYREVLFKSVNAIIKGEEFFYAKTMALPLIENWTSPELLWLKYGMTLGFTILFIFITSVGLKLSLKGRFPYLFALFTYLIITIVAGLIILYGILFSSFSEVYPLLRLFIGWIHNPLLYLMISIGAIAYYTINSMEEENIKR
jgi:hypothetical protein